MCNLLTNTCLQMPRIVSSMFHSVIVAIVRTYCGQVLLYRRIYTLKKTAFHSRTMLVPSY